MLIGYARVSTDDQTLDLQLDALKKAGCSEDKTYKDKISSAKADRPGLKQAFDQLREGDTLVVWRLDRLGRSLQELISLVNGIRAKGADFKSLTENMDTNTSGGKLVFHFFGALAEYERSIALHADPSHTVEDICNTLHISRATLYRYVGMGKG